MIVQNGQMISADACVTVVGECYKHNELTKPGEAPIILILQTAQCGEINMAMLSKLSSPVQEVHATDTMDTVVDHNSLVKIEHAYKEVQKDVTQTSRMEKTLNLSHGAKVMLKNNKGCRSRPRACLMLQMASKSKMSFECDES